MADEFNDEDGDPFDVRTGLDRATHAEAKYKADEDFARNLLEQRKGAYARVFEAGTPTDEDRRIVKEDLALFCRHMETAYSDSERVHCLITGRQEVYLRIHDFTRLSVDALVLKYVTPRKE